MKDLIIILMMALSIVGIFGLCISSLNEGEKNKEKIETIEQKLDEIASRSDAGREETNKRIDEIKVEMMTMQLDRERKDAEISDEIEEIKVNLTKEVTEEVTEETTETTEVGVEQVEEPVTQLAPIVDGIRIEKCEHGSITEFTDGNCIQDPEPIKTYAGHYELTAYIETGNACADGVYPQVGYTVACNDPALWHKWIYIDGIGERYVHDTGGMASNVIDVYVGDYDTAIQFGRQSADVYVIE